MQANDDARQYLAGGGGQRTDSGRFRRRLWLKLRFLRFLLPNTFSFSSAIILPTRLSVPETPSGNGSRAASSTRAAGAAVPSSSRRRRLPVANMARLDSAAATPAAAATGKIFQAARYLFFKTCRPSPILLWLVLRERGHTGPAAAKEQMQMCPRRCYCIEISLHRHSQSFSAYSGP